MCPVHDIAEPAVKKCGLVHRDFNVLLRVVQGSEAEVNGDLFG